MTQILLLVLTVPFLLFGTASHKRAALKDLSASVVVHTKEIHKTAKGLKKMFLECSGTYITSYSIITAAHCFQNTGESTIWARGPYETVGYPVHIVYWDKKADLALLDAPFHHPYVKIGKMPKWGDRVTNIGSPYDFEFVQSEGKVSMTDYHAVGYSSSYLITTAMANPGSSGGGAFNDAGQLIGVNTMIIGFFGWQGLTMSVNPDSINTFLRDAFKYYKHYGGQHE